MKSYPHEIEWDEPFDPRFDTLPKWRRARKGYRRPGRTEGGRGGLTAPVSFSTETADKEAPM